VDLTLQAVDQTMDRYLDEAVKNTLNALKPVWQPEFAAGTLRVNSSKQLDAILSVAGGQAPAKVLLSLLKGGKISKDSFGPTVDRIAEGGDTAILAGLFELNLNDTTQQAKVLSSLARAARDRKTVPVINDSVTTRLQQWINGNEENIKAEAMRLAGAWKIKGLQEALLQEVSHPNSERVLFGAMAGLGSFGGTNSTRVLYKQGQSGSSKEVRYAAIAALAEFDQVNAASCVVSALSRRAETQPAQEEITRLLDILFEHKSTAQHMASIIWVNGDSLPHLNPDSCKLALRAMKLKGRSGPDYEELAKRLSDAAGLTAETPVPSREEILKWVNKVAQKGDAARGEKIFHRDELTCLKCHAIASAGGVVGPDLSAVGGGSSVDYLIESILDPNKVIKDNFETIEVTTKDDETYLGIRVREDKNELVLKDVAHPELAIDKEKIRDRSNRKTSLMPAGLTAGLTHDEFIDLVRFLSELGKPGAYANNPKPFVRRWRLQDGDSWVPAYSHVNGDFWPVLPSGQPAPVARCEVEVTTPGKIALNVNSTRGLKLVVGQKNIEVKPTVLLELERGVHLLEFRIDKNRSEPVHVEFAEVEGSPGRFQLVGGP
jgi:putative heme-binding domain-containing protein